MGTTTVHEELIEIKFETDQGKMKLADLHAQAEALLKLFGAPIPVGGLLGGGAAGGGSGSTVSSTTMMQQHAAQAAQQQAAQGGGAVSHTPAPSGGATVPSGALAGGGGGGGGGATVPSGAGGGGATVPSGAGAGGSGGGGAGGGGGRGKPNGGWGDFDIYGKRMMPLMFAGATGGSGGAVQALGTGASMAIGGPLGMAAKVAGDLVASSLGAMKESNARRAVIESEMGYAAMSGMLTGFAPAFGDLGGYHGEDAPDKLVNALLAYGSNLGIDPNKTVAGTREYLTAAGGTFGPGMPMSRPSPWVDMMVAGISPSTVGALDSQILTNGAGGDHTSASRLAGVGSYGFGLTGGLDAWLQKLTMHIDRFVERGLRLNLDDVSHLLERVGADPLLRQRPNEAPKVIGAMGGVLGDAKSQLLAPFAQLGNAAVMMKAMEGGGGIEQWVERIEKMGPKGALDALNGLAGDMAPLALNALSPSLRMDEARAWGHLPGKAPSWKAPRFTDPYWRDRSRNEAAKEWDSATWKAGTKQQHRQDVESSRAWSGWGDTAAKMYTDAMMAVGELMGQSAALIESAKSLKTQLDKYWPPSPTTSPAAEDEHR